MSVHNYIRSLCRASHPEWRSVHASGLRILSPSPFLLSQNRQDAYSHARARDLRLVLAMLSSRRRRCGLRRRAWTLIASVRSPRRIRLPPSRALRRSKTARQALMRPCGLIKLTWPHANPRVCNALHARMTKGSWWSTATLLPKRAPILSTTCRARTGNAARVDSLRCAVYLRHFGDLAPDTCPAAARHGETDGRQHNCLPR